MTMKLEAYRIVSAVLLFGLAPLAFSAGFQRTSSASTAADVAARVHSAYPGGSRALIIVNSNYRTGWPKLHAAEADGERIRRMLIEQAFDEKDIELHRDLTGEQLSRVLNAFAARRPADASGSAGERRRAVVYFAGHGYSDGTRGGYLVPVDAPLPSANQQLFFERAINVAQLQVMSIAMTDSDVLFLLDSCFSGLALQLVPQVAIGPRDLVAREQRVRQIIAAGSGTQSVADDGEYTARVAAGVAGLADLNSDGWISAGELGVYLRLRLSEQYNGHQTPIFGNLIIPAASIGAGEMLFASPTQIRGDARSGGAPRGAAGKRETFRDCDACPEMVAIPFDLLMAGAASSRTDTYGLAFGVDEVTFAEWDACFASGGCRRWLPDRGAGRGRMPAFGVSREDADEYARWLTTRTQQKYRLATEAEWEAAARAGSQAPTQWGAHIPKAGANCRDCGSIWDGRPAPVGQFAANDFGLRDMLGNLWELTSSCATLAAPAATECDAVWVKGGAFTTESAQVRFDTKGVMPVKRRDINVGFRVIRELRD